MKCKRIIWIVILFFLIVDSANSQSKKIKELTVGDTIPDILIKNIINYPDTAVYISSFSNRILILDFWATWCSPCISSFPKLDSLQKIFGSKIQILSVTTEDKEKVKDLFEKMNKIKGLSPASVTNDNVLWKHFPFLYMPHYVWILNRKVFAITEGSDVNATNIKNIINNKIVNLRIKDDGTKKKIIVEKGKSFFTVGINIKRTEEQRAQLTTMADSELLIHSTLTPYLESARAGFESDSTTIRAINLNICWLFRIALWKSRNPMLNLSQTIIEVDSPLYEKITGANFDGRSVATPGLEAKQWLRANGYCYELKTPKELREKRFDIMLSELNSYFGAIYGIEGKLETRKTQYLALVRIDSSMDFATKGGVSSLEQNSFFLRMKNGSLNTLKTSLMLPLQKYPLIIDETNYKGNVDLEINCLLSDLNAVNVELKKYGLMLEKKEKMMQVASIKRKIVSPND